jgi:uncharacterized protein (TIGR04562 family)
VAATRDNFTFSWPFFKVLLDGESIVDVPRLEIQTMEEATNFIQAYGFDPGDAEDVDLMWRAFDESVTFLERSIADPEYPKVPDHLRNRKAVNDIRRLLLIASDKSAGTDQIFTCAILRLMHLYIHIHHDPRLQFFDEVQNQILNRLENYLYVDAEKGVTYLGKPEDPQNSIKLVYFKKKDRKDREREIIKLLHKKENAVEEIYDRIGFRLVTETKFDAIRVVRLLVEKNIISVPNVRPGRSRNRLVDFKRLVFEVERIHTHFGKNNGPTPYIEKMIRRLDSRIGFSRLGRSLINPHTSEHYRAIQFTCRELVRIRNPQYQAYEKLRVQLSNLHGGDQVLNEAFPTQVQKYLHVFFPYELQIMDVKSYADSIFGKSSHEEYRRKQLESARLRLFGRRPA